MRCCKQATDLLADVLELRHDALGALHASPWRCCCCRFGCHQKSPQTVATRPAGAVGNPRIALHQGRPTPSQQRSTHRMARPCFHVFASLTALARFVKATVRTHRWQNTATCARTQALGRGSSSAHLRAGWLAGCSAQAPVGALVARPTATTVRKVAQDPRFVAHCVKCGSCPFRLTSAERSTASRVCR